MIKQFKISFDNFSYIIYCEKSKKAAVVDPGFDAEKILKCITEETLDLQYIINTHHHSDHTSGNSRIKEKINSSKIIASKLDGEKIGADIFVGNNETIMLGDIELKFLLTPGHTPGGICIIVNNETILTGDTLFIGDCGRTDLPGGSFEEMFKTLHEKIMVLPDNLIVYPGHDYGNKPFDTLGNQKNKNKTLTARNLEEFSRIP